MAEKLTASPVQRGAEYCPLKGGNVTMRRSTLPCLLLLAALVLPAFAQGFGGQVGSTAAADTSIVGVSPGDSWSGRIQPVPVVYVMFEYPSPINLRVRITSVMGEVPQVPLWPGMKAVFYASNPATALGTYRSGLWQRAFVRYAGATDELPVHPARPDPKLPVPVQQYIRFELGYEALKAIFDSPDQSVQVMVEYVAGRSHKNLLGAITFGSADIAARDSTYVPFRLVWPELKPEAYRHIIFQGLSAEQLWFYDHCIGGGHDIGAVDLATIKKFIGQEGLQLNVTSVPLEEYDFSRANSATEKSYTPPNPRGFQGGQASLDSSYVPTRQREQTETRPEYHEPAPASASRDPISIDVIQEPRGFQIEINGRVIRASGKDLFRARFERRNGDGRWTAVEHDSKGRYIRAATIDWGANVQGLIRVTGFTPSGRPLGQAILRVRDNGRI